MSEVRRPSWGVAILYSMSTIAVAVFMSMAITFLGVVAVNELPDDYSARYIVPIWLSVQAVWVLGLQLAVSVGLARTGASMSRVERSTYLTCSLAILIVTTSILNGLPDLVDGLATASLGVAWSLWTLLLPSYFLATFWLARMVPELQSPRAKLSEWLDRKTGRVSG